MVIQLGEVELLGGGALQEDVCLGGGVYLEMLQASLTFCSLCFLTVDAMVTFLFLLSFLPYHYRIYRMYLWEVER